MRYAIRGFLRQPGLALAAVLSLAIGIGANTAIFSVAYAVLLRPLPYPDADRLAILWNRSPGLNITEDWFSTAQYFDIKTAHSGFDQLAIAIGSNVNLTGDGEPERVGVIRASSNLLTMLGAQPALGALFTEANDAPGGGAAAVLSHGTWVRRYGADARVVGRTITLNGQVYPIVGVLSERFSLPREVLPTLGVAEDGEIFLPLPLAPDAARVRTREDYNIVGKLKPGVSATEANAEMTTITARLRRDFPDVYPANGGLTFDVVPLDRQVSGDIRQPLLVLIGAVGLVLLVACANVANLLLSRALARAKEIAVRASLGASRAQIVRQLLTESLVLSLAGGALGVALAALGVRWLHALQPKNIPRLADISVNAPVLFFTLALSVIAGVLFGLAPALGLRRLDVQRALADGGRGTSVASAVWGRGNNLRRVLVVAQIALSLMLLSGAGLLIRSFSSLQRVAPGFSPAGVLSFELTMTGRKYADGPTVVHTYRALWDRLDGVPGVIASGGVSSLPLSGYFSWGPITVEGRTPPPGERFINADQRIVSGRYFEAMGIPLVSGRLFRSDDTPEKPRVVVIDAFMAAELWPGVDPVGKRLRFGDANATGPWQTVVGVVGRVKQYGLDTDGRIAVYIPQTQSATRALYVVVKSAGDAAAIAAAVRQQVRALDPDLPLYRVRTMDTRVEESLARQRFAMVLLTVFAALALVLATIGIYGVISHLVSQGVRELGIRIALGATPGSIRGLVLGHAVRLLIAGVAVGLFGALLLTRLMSTLLFGVHSRDPLTFSIVTVVLAIVAIAACAIPARRASRLDPMDCLRSV